MPHRLIGLAWLNVVTHVLGLGLAAVGIRPGSPLVPLDDRLAYLAGAHPWWTVAWITWMVCAAALIAFLAAVVFRLDEDARLARLGLTIAVTGAACDLLCDSIFLAVLPTLASSSIPHVFVTVERITGLASLAIANGAYSLAILLITIDLGKRPESSRLTTLIGYGVGGFGFLLAAAGFTAVPELAMWATPPTIGLFCAWTLLVARAGMHT